MTVAELKEILNKIPSHYEVVSNGDLYGPDETWRTVTIIGTSAYMDEDAGKAMKAWEADWYDIVAYDPDEVEPEGETE